MWVMGGYEIRSHPDLISVLYPLVTEEGVRKGYAYGRPVMANANGLVFAYAGGTHYVFLKPVLSELAGPNVALIETGAAVARQLARVLDERDLRADGDRGRERFWTSGDPTASTRVISALLGRRVAVERLPDL